MNGFREIFSTIDRIQTVSQIIENSKEYDTEVWLMFVDFNKEFDSLLHGKMWQAC